MLDYFMIILCSENWSGGVMTGDLVDGNQTVRRGYCLHLRWYESEKLNGFTSHRTFSLTPTIIRTSKLKQRLITLSSNLIPGQS
jgi:hypothetical protein